MSSQAVFSNGIFHGLPMFPKHDGKSYTAIVAGASGISGSYIIRALTRSASRWNKIYAVSRKAPVGRLAESVEHIPVDLLEDPERVAETLRGKVVKV
jgi:hypothetical protein